MTARPAQTLLELIIAIGVILVSTFSATTLIVTTITSGQVSQTKVEAANLAREGVEVVRGLRDTNTLLASQNLVYGPTGTTYTWDSGLNAGQYQAIFSDTTNAWTLSAYNAAQDTISQPQGKTYLTQNCAANCTRTKYHRRITLSKPNDTFFAAGDASYINVVSVVWWGPLPKDSYTATERLYDWK